MATTDNERGLGCFGGIMNALLIEAAAILLFEFFSRLF
jgi:hypothetical protein